MTANDLRLPPDDAWIERREEISTETQESRAAGIEPGKRTRRIAGNLSGAWPSHGRVRHLPTESGQVTITEASLVVFGDGTVRAELD